MAALAQAVIALCLARAVVSGVAGHNQVTWAVSRMYSRAFALISILSDSCSCAANPKQSPPEAKSYMHSAGVIIEHRIMCLACRQHPSALPRTIC